ncbi:ADF-like domain-containing protein [Mycena indigotica]|uniref:ADF-like domain-containing protein n=1 Tax=Mycena indigotica TaxID=2126181 RepID=A0A8H6TFF2_9AGAR|nr:ADF-like domain-containing protein [Mycena indigotica]KAF7316371.1 ADF-like domain-containing protein [Mycena indigotica]
MADCTDPAIDAAYQDVRSDKSETNWVLLDYESDRSDKLTVTASGSGGLAELREALDDGKASFAYARVSYSNDKESTREKFILVVSLDRCVFLLGRTWKPTSIVPGPQCKVMRKAKISVHAADVKQTLRVFSIEVAAREKDDINHDAIVTRLRKAGGASYDGV